MLGGPSNGAHDVFVAGAAAKRTRDRLADLGLRRLRVAVEQPAGGHHHRRRAEPALQPVLVHEALLDRVELGIALQPFDRAHLAAADHRGQHGAALHRHAVDLHHAHPAVGGVAAPVRPGEPQLVPQEVHQQ
jgi:hypothetical protein